MSWNILTLRRLRGTTPGFPDPPPQENDSSLEPVIRERLAPETADSIMCLRYWLGMPEVTQEERTRFDNSLEDGTEAEFLVDHYLPEDDNLGDGHMDILTEEDMDLLVDEDMGMLVDDVQE
jgi:hypothetical protein